MAVVTCEAVTCMVVLRRGLTTRPHRMVVVIVVTDSSPLVSRHGLLPSVSCLSSSLDVISDRTAVGTSGPSSPTPPGHDSCPPRLTCTKAPFFFSHIHSPMPPAPDAAAAVVTAARFTSGPWANSWIQWHVL